MYMNFLQEGSLGLQKQFLVNRVKEDTGVWKPKKIYCLCNAGL